MYQNSTPIHFRSYFFLANILVRYLRPIHSVYCEDHNEFLYTFRNTKISMAILNPRFAICQSIFYFTPVRAKRFSQMDNDDISFEIHLPIVRARTRFHRFQ